MLKNLDFKKAIPHVVAFVLFYLLPLIYFNPVLEGLSLVQGDISSFKGMAKSIQDHRAVYEEEALWSDAMFAGMPAYQIATRYDSNLFHFVDRFILSLFYSGPHLLLFLCCIGFYILLLTLKIDPWLSMVGAFAFAFSSYFPILIEAGHNSKLHAIAYLPAALAGFIQVYRGKLMQGGLLFAVFMSFEILSNHIQVTYYFALMLLVFGAYYLFQSIKEKQIPAFLKQTAVLVVAGVIALLCNAAMLYNTYKYSKETMRGKSELTINPQGTENKNQTSGLDIDYLTQWSYGIGETWSLIIPDIKGGASGAADYERGRQINSYWGDQPFTSGPVYVGAFMLLLFILGFFVLEGVFKWPVIISTVLFMLISWGRNTMWFTELLVDYLPMYSKFRTPSMALLVVEMLVPLSAVLVLNKFMKKPDLLKDNKLKKKLLAVSGGLILIILAFAIMPDSFFDFYSPKELIQFEQIDRGNNSGQVVKMMDSILDYRTGVVASDAFRSIFIILLSGVLAFIFIKRQSVILLALTIGIITVVDLWTVDKRYVNNEKVRGKYVRWEKKRPYFLAHLPNASDESILNNEMAKNPELNVLVAQAAQKAGSGLSKEERSFKNYLITNKKYQIYNQNSNFRVFQLNNPFNESRTSFFHKSVGGYSAVKLGKYQDFIDFYLNQEIGAIGASLKNGGADILQVFSNRKYLNMLNTKYVVYNPEAPAIENPYAYGNAWFVEEVKTVNSADEEITALAQIDLYKQAVMQTSAVEKIGGIKAGAQGTITQTLYKANELVYSCNLIQDGFAVFSEVYYEDGWNAYIDGEIQPIAKVNYLLRGLNVPANSKEIVLKFEPKAYKITSNIGYASSALLLIGALVFLFMQVRKETIDGA